MNLIEQIVCWVVVSLAAGLGVLLVLQRFMTWMVARSKRQLAAAEARLEQARADAKAATEELERTQRFIATYNLAPAPEPALVQVCCKKAEPCERHAAQ